MGVVRTAPPFTDSHPSAFWGDNNTGQMTASAMTAATNPSHPHLVKVMRSPEPFASGNISQVKLPAGAHFVNIENVTPAERHYTTVQVSKDSHVALNSDLVYCNHSCNPSLVFDMGKMEVRVVGDRSLSVGDPLTFFYPSTEWEMDQPFECHCHGAGGRPCQGTIRGAKYLSEEDVKGYWLNEHIIELRAQQGRTAQEEADGGRKKCLLNQEEADGGRK